jgi:DNA-binding response OmpR family regulator
MDNVFLIMWTSHYTMNDRQLEGTSKASILIVEDNMPLAMMMVRMLSRIGCEVLIASTGKAGMQLTLEKQFDLIILAVDLPDINGLEVCREIKQRHFSRHTPIVFISGQLCEKDRQHGFKLGAADYIVKPLAARDFISRLLTHLKRKASTVYTGNGAPVES